jgi:hypothetical protein
MPNYQTPVYKPEEIEPRWQQRWDAMDFITPISTHPPQALRPDHAALSLR